MLAHAARAETKRPHIERAALRLFVSRGVRGATIRDLPAKRVAEWTMGTVDRLAIHRRRRALPRRLAQYEHELVDAVLATLTARRRRTT